MKILYKYLNLNFQNSGYRHPTEEKKKEKRWVCKHTPIFSRVERRWYKARNDQSTLVLSCLILIFFKVWQYRKRRKNNVIIFLGLIPFTTECLDKLKNQLSGYSVLISLHLLLYLHVFIAEDVQWPTCKKKKLH